MGAYAKNKLGKNPNSESGPIKVPCESGGAPLYMLLNRYFYSIQLARNKRNGGTHKSVFVTHNQGMENKPKGSLVGKGSMPSGPNGC